MAMHSPILQAYRDLASKFLACREDGISDTEILNIFLQTVDITARKPPSDPANPIEEP